MIEISDIFSEKVNLIAKKLDINPMWLNAVMYLESGLKSTAVNAITGATGLIQFMPATAKQLGTTVEKLKNMSAVDQLDYVYKYLSTYAGKMKSLIDVYFAVFFPIAINKADDFILQTSKLSASIIADANAGYDLNKDRTITVAEVKDAITKRLIKVGFYELAKKKVRG